MIDYPDVCRAVEAQGLVARGGFRPRAEDGVPALSPGREARCLVLVGMTASRGWAAFRASVEWARPVNPLDAFSERVIGELAASLDAGALFPFKGPPWWPFQRWAARAESLAPSPLGLLIHPRHGLWHGYRGALTFDASLSGLAPPRPWTSPCLDCDGRPCLSACPVGAFSDHGFDSDACAGQLERNGEPCLDAGCLARAACPYVPQARYPREQRRFHMQAFSASVRSR